MNVHASAVWAHPVASLFYYQARISWRASQYAALALSLGMPLFLALPEAIVERPAVLIALLQTFWPMVGAFAFGPLFSQEREHGTHELSVVRQSAPALAFLATLCTGLLALLLCGSITLVAFSLRVPVALSPAVAAGLPGALLLGGMSVAISIFSRNSAAAVLFPLGYWLFDVFTDGSHTGRFSLLANSTADRAFILLMALLLVGVGYWRYTKTSIN